MGNSIINFGKIAKKNRFLDKKEQELSLLVILIFLVIIFSVFTKTFFAIGNFIAISSNVAVIGITSVGMAVALISNNIDVSVGAVIAFSSTVIVILDGMYPNLSIWIKILIALLSGFFWGSINGLIVTKIGLNPMITTLGTMMLIRGVAYTITTKYSSLLNKGLLKYTRLNIFNRIPISFIYMIAIFIIVFFIIKRTKFGRSVYAVGDNKNSAKLMGLNVDKIQYLAFVVSALCAALAGVILVGQISIGRADNATGSEFDALTIIILGGIGIKGGRGNLFGVFIAVLIFATITNGLVHFGLNMFWKEVFKGFILIIAVSIEIIRRRRSVFQQIS